MPIYNLLEYSDNYSLTSRRLRNFYRDEINDFSIEINHDGNKRNKNKTITNKCFEYKTKIIGRAPDGNNTLDADVAVSSKYLITFF